MSKKFYGNFESIILLQLDHKINVNILLTTLSEYVCVEVWARKLRNLICKSLPARTKIIGIIAKCISSTNLANNKILMFQFPPLLGDNDCIRRRWNSNKNARAKERNKWQHLMRQWCAIKWIGIWMNPKRDTKSGVAYLYIRHSEMCF